MPFVPVYDSWILHSSQSDVWWSQSLRRWIGWSSMPKFVFYYTCRFPISHQLSMRWYWYICVRGCVTFLFLFSPFVADNDSGSLLGLELTWTWIVLVAISSFLAIGAGLIGMSICFCRRAPHSSDNHIQCEYKAHEAFEQIRLKLNFVFSKSCDRFKWLNKVRAHIISATDNSNDYTVGKLASPCGTIRVLPHHTTTTQIADGHSPSHLVPGKLLNMQQFDPPDLSQTTTSTTITNATQKEEWFV